MQQLVLSLVFAVFPRVVFSAFRSLMELLLRDAGCKVGHIREAGREAQAVLRPMRLSTDHSPEPPLEALRH